MSSDRASSTTYDIILIGSGIGALTVASLMAQLRDRRILVIERHFRAGGFTHSFKRQQFQFDPGIHYVGQLEEGSSLRQLIDLVTNKGLVWGKLPEPLETFIYPNLTFDVYGNPSRYQEDLIQRFPSEAKAIRRYFRDLPQAASALFLQILQVNGTLSFKLLGWLGRTFWNRTSLNLTTQGYLDRHFQSSQLKALLASQWGDYGLPPSQSPFALHATIALHYLEGAYYPIGGPGKIADCVRAFVEEKDGRFLLNREVTEVLLEGGKAVGVRARKVNANNNDHFEEYYAPTIVSDVGAVNTYLKLIPDRVAIPFRDGLQQFLQKHPPATNVSLYLGLKDDPRKVGFDGKNYWIYEQFDHDAIYRQRGDWIEDSQPQQAFLSFPSLKNPDSKAHTAEVTILTDYDRFSRWREQSWLHRDADYQALKEHLRRKILNSIERHYPGFSDLVEFCEVSTPITTEYLTAHPKGGIYGLPLTSERFHAENQAWTQVKTPIPGLYLTGADACMMGFAGAAIGGAIATGHLPDGISLPQIFKSAARNRQSSANSSSRNAVVR